MVSAGQHVQCYAIGSELLDFELVFRKSIHELEEYLNTRLWCPVVTP